MKIYADENVEHSIVEGLRRRNVEIVSARELGHIGKPDEFHIKKASQMNAVILTHDIDFLRIASRSGNSHNGIIFLRSKNISIGKRKI